MSSKQQRLQGLYAITDPKLTPPVTLLAQVEKALIGGARILQYRDKSNDQVLRKEQASALLELCEQYNACFIVNDDVTLASEVNAHGVHLGLTDAPLSRAREILGETAIIGATCHGSVDNAEQAINEGADYVAFGRFFPSSTKPGAAPANLDEIASKLSTLSVPSVAIGGITLTNAPQLRAAGFDMLAVVADIFAHADITAHCQQYADLLAE